LVKPAFGGEDGCLSIQVSSVEKLPLEALTLESYLLDMMGEW